MIRALLKRMEHGDIDAAGMLAHFSAPPSRLGPRTAEEIEIDETLAPLGVLQQRAAIQRIASLIAKERGVTTSVVLANHGERMYRRLAPDLPVDPAPVADRARLERMTPDELANFIVQVHTQLLRVFRRRVVPSESRVIQ